MKRHFIFTTFILFTHTFSFAETVTSSTSFLCQNFFAPNSVSQKVKEVLPEKTLSFGTQYAVEVNGSKLKVHDYVNDTRDVISFDYSKETPHGNLHFPLETIQTAKLSRNEGLVLTHSKNVVASWKLTGNLKKHPDIKYIHTNVEKILSSNHEDVVFSFSKKKIKISDFSAEIKEISLEEADPRFQKFIQTNTKEIEEVEFVNVASGPFLVLVKKTKINGQLDRLIGVYNIRTDEFQQTQFDKMLTTTKDTITLRNSLPGYRGESDYSSIEFLKLGAGLSRALVKIVSEENSSQSSFYDFYTLQLSIGTAAAIKQYYENNPLYGSSAESHAKTERIRIQVRSNIINEATQQSVPKKIVPKSNKRFLPTKKVQKTKFK